MTPPTALTAEEQETIVEVKKLARSRVRRLGSNLESSTLNKIDAIIRRLDGLVQTARAEQRGADAALASLMQLSNPSGIADAIRSQR